MFHRFRNLVSDRRGAAVIELALVAPVLAVTVIGIVDMSNAYSRKLALEQGAQRAIEKIMQTTADDTVENTLATEAVCQVNGTNSDGTCKTSPITTSNVTVSFRLECWSGTTINSTQTSTVAATFDAMTCNSGEKEARYIQVALTDRYVPLFPVHFASYAPANGSIPAGYPLSATAGMRTE